VLEFLTMDDAWVVSFCATISEDYMTPMMALNALRGAAGRHWT
jgi:hypothetical protein